MQKDGSLGEGAGGDVEFEVAAASFDLFDAYEGALRPFFGMVLQSTTLRWFSVPNAGLDSPVFTAVLERGVRLTNAHVTDIPISEFVLRSVLDVFQQAELWRDAQRRTAWDRHQFREVAGTTWLIVGLGTIGQAVAVRARAFGARVVGCRRNPPATSRSTRSSHPPTCSTRCTECRRRRAFATVGGRRTAARRCGVPRRDGRGIGAGEHRSGLAHRRGGARRRARPRPAATAILDVMQTEPLPDDSPLWTHPHVVLTPAQLGRRVRPLRALRRPARRQLGSLRARRTTAQRDHPHLRNLLVVLSASTLPPVWHVGQ